MQTVNTVSRSLRLHPWHAGKRTLRVQTMKTVSRSLRLHPWLSLSGTPHSSRKAENSLRPMKKGWLDADTEKKTNAGAMAA